MRKRHEQTHIHRRDVMARGQRLRAADQLDQLQLELDQLQLQLRLDQLRLRRV